ncbi:MAG: ABC transporter substrate-binding protein [Bryobacteraceae bacterium]
MNADLISINRATQITEPALAKSWTVSKDGLHYTLRLRQGLRFSDGHPCDASDVVFSFQVYLDEKTGSPQRDLLIIDDKPVAVKQVDAGTVVFDLAKPYAAAERIFDSVAILPRHLLEKAWREGKITEAWTLAVTPESIAGLGPFCLKEFKPGEKVVLRRNPYYWKVDQKGRRLPYLDEIEFQFAGSEEAQILRFSAGQADVLNRLSSRDFAFLEKEKAAKGYRLVDLGEGMEYNFLFFNLTPDKSPKYPWFSNLQFRKAISAAIDRDALVRLVYQGRAVPLSGHVPPGNRRWVNDRLPKAARSLDQSRQLLKAAGFRLAADGTLQDSNGKTVEFSIATSASNPERVQMATLIQDDLRQLGIRVQVAPIEFRTLLDKVLNKRDFEAAILSMGNGDADPNAEMNIWLSSGATHLWNPSQKQPATTWEAEVDHLMHQQVGVLQYAKRKQLYDRVQEIVAGQLPFLFLVSPNVLVAASGKIGNFQAAVLDHHTLWNADRLFIRETVSPPAR